MDANTNPAATDETAALEREAVRLADANDVEAAWTLRGMIDRVEGHEWTADGSWLAPSYRSYYVAGYNAVAPGDVVTPAMAIALAGSL